MPLVATVTPPVPVEVAESGTYVQPSQSVSVTWPIAQSLISIVTSNCAPALTHASGRSRVADVAADTGSAIIADRTTIESIVTSDIVLAFIVVSS